MKEYLADHIRGAASPTARNLVREYLQARILGSLQRSGAMIPLAFQGGTALRFLYSIRRYSEDLDFALQRPDRGYNFRSYLAQQRTPADQLAGRRDHAANWRGVLATRVKGLDWERILSDVRPFLEDPAEVDLQGPFRALKGARNRARSGISIE
ncbi:MAG TPA: nucleotidyl transferase AbiEii/AbiGii toxin family protein [Thermoanaerobaculia bacterium]|nr:nucleotidyl transferase AbiEii/AbiGii toxin family protein [Thermoanaerobaculia bacterium]